MSRTLRIIGMIDTEGYKEFSMALAELEKKPRQPVKVELNSEGGDVYDALAYYDRIRLSACEIHILVIGQASSAAVLVLAAGDERAMTANSWVMVHEDSTEGTLQDKRVGQAEKDLKHLRRLEDQWNKLLEDKTDTKAEIWGNLHAAETFLTADECLGLGLIHEII